MESSPAWLSLNEGYRNRWPASRCLRCISSICSQQAIKLLRVSFGGTRARPYGLSRRPVGRWRLRSRRWCSEDGKVAEISTIQDRFTPLKQIGCLPGGICAAQPALAGAQACRGVGDLGPHLHRKPYTGFRLCHAAWACLAGCLVLAAVGGNELLVSFPAERLRASLRRS
jgi:hypothetical protein